MKPLLLGLLSFALGFTGAVVPGPLLVVVLSESPRRGVAAGFLAVFGHAVLEMAMVAALAVGLGFLLRSPLAEASVALVGGCAMLTFSAIMVWHALKGEYTSKSGRVFPYGPLLGGLVATALNPYWYVWWATVASPYIAVSVPLGVVGLLAFYVGHVLADAAWYVPVSAVVGYGGRRFEDRYLNWLVLGCGVLLALFGVEFLLFASTRLPGLL